MVQVVVHYTKLENTGLKLHPDANTFTLFLQHLAVVHTTVTDGTSLTLVADAFNYPELTNGVTSTSIGSTRRDPDAAQETL